MKKAGRKFWTAGWRAAVAALLLGWIFHVIFVGETRQVWERGDLLAWEDLSRAEQWRLAWLHGPRELWDTLSLVHPAWFALSVLLAGATVLLGIVRWRLILEAQGLHLPLGRATAISFIAHFFNSFLLGSTGGDLMKAYYAARETHHKKIEAVVTVFADRMIGLWSMLCFAVIMMAPNWRLLVSEERIGAPSALIALVLLGLTLFLAMAFWGGLSRRWPRARHWLRRLPKGDLLDRVLDACRQFGRTRALFLESIGISMVLNAVLVTQVAVLAFGLGIVISPVPLLAIVPIIIFLAALPITPSGLGVRENLFVFMLAAPALGVPATLALALSLLAYAGTLFWSIVGGLVYLGLRDREHLVEIAEEQEDPVAEAAACGAGAGDR